MWFWIASSSLVVNLFLFFYVRWLLKTLEVINNDVVDLTDLVGQYSTHVESVYELEMFYGDETLKSLMEHSRELVDKIKNLDLVLNEEEYADATTPPQED